MVPHTRKILSCLIRDVFQVPVNTLIGEQKLHCFVLPVRCGIHQSRFNILLSHEIWIHSRI